MARSPSPKKRPEFLLKKSKSRKYLQKDEPGPMGFDKMRKSKHLVKVREFKDKIEAFKKKPRNQDKRSERSQKQVMKNQSEMIPRDKQGKLGNNRSFHRQLKEAKKMTFNLYKQQKADDGQSAGQLNSTGEIKLKSNRRISHDTGKGNLSGQHFYNSTREIKNNAKTVNLYNTALKANDDKPKAPVQLMKTRSKNSSFVKKKTTLSNNSTKKNFEIKSYQSGSRRNRRPRAAGGQRAQKPGFV